LKSVRDYFSKCGVKDMGKVVFYDNINEKAKIHLI